MTTLYEDNWHYVDEAFSHCTVTPDVAWDVRERIKWYALDAGGEMIYLGEFTAFDEADEYARDQGIDTVWIVDASGARDWLVQLKEILK